MGESISVAMCTRNGASYVGEQVASILRQELLPDELIVSDDASTDDTVAIVRSIFEELDPASPAARVGLTVLENVDPLGVTKNFEQAVRATSGDLIALCDQDDRWHSDRLTRQAAEFESRKDLELLFTDAVLVGAEGNPLGFTLFESLELKSADIELIRDGHAFPLLLKRNLATGATIMFRRGLLTRALPFPLEWVHDEWLAIIGAATSRIDLLDEHLVDYRQHGSNEVGVRQPTLLVKMQRVLEPRGDRNVLLAVRSQRLVERLDALSIEVSAKTLREARTKTEVEAWRAALPAHRLRRAGAILRADRRGWYADYCSQGRLDMVRDLLQPHR